MKTTVSVDAAFPVKNTFMYLSESWLYYNDIDSLESQCFRNKRVRTLDKSLESYYYTHWEKFLDFPLCFQCLCSGAVVPSRGI